MLDAWLDLRTAGISNLDPSTPREPHRIAIRWRIEINLPEEGLLERGRATLEPCENGVSSE